MAFLESVSTQFVWTFFVCRFTSLPLRCLEVRRGAPFHGSRCDKFQIFGRQSADGGNYKVSGCITTHKVLFLTHTCSPCTMYLYLSDVSVTLTGGFLHLTQIYHKNKCTDGGCSQVCHIFRNNIIVTFDESHLDPCRLLHIFFCTS